MTVEQGRTCKRYVSLAIFFLKSFHFNPLNNPVFAILAILVVFFYVEGSLDKYHIALMLYLSVLGHCFIGNMFRRSRENDESISSVPIDRYFKALPVSGRGVYVSYLLSSTLYAVIISTALVVLLTKFMELPDLSGIEFTRSVAPDGDTITTVSGIAFSRRFVPRFVSFVLEKSLFFDVISKTGGAPVLISLYFILAFLYISIFQVFKEFSRIRQASAADLFHRLPFAVYFLLTLVFLTEVMLTQREIGIGVRFILHNSDIAVTFLIVTVVLTFVSVITMSQKILANLKVPSS